MKKGYKYKNPMSEEHKENIRKSALRRWKKERWSKRFESWMFWK